MRMAAYVGVGTPICWLASTVLALGVTLKAVHERPNFYSASVYLAQSNACRMILLNMLLLTAAGCVYGLQRLLYGPLRPIEIEQLWDKSWYAITETALAMTTFRDEVGGWFFIMFMSLLAGKVWGWIGEGRVEILEQQPPANPRWFHTRLMASLVLSEIFDLLMLRYCVRTLLEQPRPGMMVMFAFEFAVLAIVSTSTAARYALTLQEIVIIQRQTLARIEERKQEIRDEREEAHRQATVDGAESTSTPHNPAEPIEVDESEIDVPGWQEKGRWVLFLDLATDFCKLLVYFGFFAILLVFHSIPIHIIRDVFITSRSFVKRIADFIKYRNATRDMNAKYPDATPEDLERDCTCIICREEMRPWQPPNAQPVGAPAAQLAVRAPMDERQRPKKLPCGHILHFGCLRSWLERQQVCPTCRASVLAPPPQRASRNQPGAGHGLPQGAEADPNAGHGNGQGQGGGIVRGRTFALGPLRLTLAAGRGRDVQNLLRHARNNHQQRPVDARMEDALGGMQPPGTNGEGLAISEHLDIIQRRIMREINSLNYAQDQLATVRALQGEFARLRIGQSHAARVPLDQEPIPYPAAQHAAFSSAMGVNPSHSPGMDARAWSFPGHSGLREPGRPFAFATHFPQQHVFGANSATSTLAAGHPQLPEGLTIPEGWSLLPLQRTVPATLEGGDDLQPRDLDPNAVLAQNTPATMAQPSQHVELPTTSSESSTIELSAQSISQVADANVGSDQNSAEGASTSNLHGYDGLASDTSVLPGLPNWSNPAASSSLSPTTSDSNIAEAQGDQSASTNDVAIAPPSESASSSATHNDDSTEDKGKGRVVTVEDIPEDPED